MFGNLLGNSVDSMINIFLKTKGISLVNAKIERYGKVTELYKDGDSYYAKVLLLGYDGLLEVAMRGLDIDQACTRARLGKFSASELWLEHLLEDHACGREVPIPEGARATLKPFIKFV